MRVLKWAAAVAAAAAMALAFAVPAGASAHRGRAALAAAESHPLPKVTAGDPYNVCLKNNTGICWVFNGVGQQLSVSGSSASSITLKNGPNGGIMFQNANGHCAYVNGQAGGYPLEEANASCSGTDSQNFTAHYCAGGCQGDYYITTRQTGPDLDAAVMVFNDVGGKPVWVNFDNGWAQWICRANGLQYAC